jgi:y4mF family transcriptional regulator
MKISDSKSLGGAIRMRRKQLGFTQQYIADFTGLSVSFLSELENGKPTAELEKTLKVVNLLALDLSVEARG